MRNSHLARLRGLEAGLHAYLELQADLNARALAAAAWKRKVVVAPLDACYYGEPDRQGLILGYGGLTHHALVAGATILREAIEQQARGR